MPKFYVVGTPIGNMEDITFRAVRILNEVDLVLCEDTRVTKNLLNKYNIKTPTFSYPSDNLKPGVNKANPKIEYILKQIEEGRTLALVSDAGTPTISDPGSVLVSKIKEAFPANAGGPEVEIIAIPGPSAVISALSISGLNVAEFTFLGFLPHKKGRETLFKEIAESERVMVFYESPHRIMKALSSLVKFAPEKKVTIARELTKVFEQIVSGTPAEVEKYFTDNGDKVRGEFVVLVSGK
ncbi:MAG: 16S rRNA (cytidine(1402)-2'-O)-methyltransferase [bacterium]